MSATGTAAIPEPGDAAPGADPVPAPVPTPAPAPGDVLRAACRQGVFSGAAWSTGTADRVLDRGWTGHRSHGGTQLTGDELWDLASVTKPVVGLAVLALVDHGTLTLDDDTAGALLSTRHGPDFRHSPAAAATVRQLLTHTSGLPGQVPLYREHPTRDALLAALAGLPLSSPPGTHVAYSSQGFILLGLMAEAAAGAPLDKLVTQLVCAPLHMTRTVFNPGPRERESAVATEHCPWRGHVVQGRVHDENAAVLGGICGHAGLFAPLADMERLGHALAGDGGGVLRPETFRLMTAGHTDRLNLRRCLAWQGQDPTGSPVGPAYGPASFGHTGFTGTSIWTDPTTGQYALLLTNRVHPTREGPDITPTRHAFHTATTALR